MHAYGMYEAKTHLSELIARVLRGEHVTITYRGKPVADLIPSAQDKKQQAHQAIAAIKAMRITNNAINVTEFDEMRSRGRK